MDVTGRGFLSRGPIFPSSDARVIKHYRLAAKQAVVAIASGGER